MTTTQAATTGRASGSGRGRDGNGPSGRYDVAIVGGGHNGLACAAYLARAGQRVVVLEAAPTVGGHCRTEASVPEAPGFLMNTGGIDHLFTHIPPSIIDDLGLSRYGLRYVDVDPLASYLTPDGGVLTLWRDLDRACADIARFSTRDAARYRELVTVLADVIHVLAPYMTGHPTRVRPVDLLTTLRRAAAHRASLRTALRVLMSPPTAVLDEWFETDAVKSALIAYTSFSMTPVDLPGIGLALIPVQHRWGLRRPVGGSGAYTRAIAEHIRAHGGEVWADMPVREVIVADGQARGVVLQSGDTVEAKHVVGAVDPTTLLTRLIDPGLLSEKVRGELRGLQSAGHNIGTFKVDVALRGRPRFPRHETGDERVVAQAMLTDIGDVRRATRQAMAGELPERPPVTVWTTTVFDPSLVPAGSEGAALYLYPVATPNVLSGGRDWATHKSIYLDRCLDVLEEYAPGTRDQIIGTNILCPDDFTTHNTAAYHVDLLPWQLGPWRPTPSLAGYRTPIDGLWHTAAGAHPTAGICGWSGRSTARSILRAPHYGANRRALGKSRGSVTAR